MAWGSEIEQLPLGRVRAGRKGAYGKASRAQGRKEVKLGSLAIDTERAFW